MKKSIILIWLLVAIKAYSEELVHNTWYEGYFINLKSDTIRGFIKHRKSPSSNIASFKYADEKKKVLHPNEIKGYGYSNKTFESCYIFKNYLFLEKIISGKISLFQKSSDYYIHKGNGDVMKINKLFAKLIVLEYIEDNPTQYQQIKSIGELTSQNLILIISDYNKWVQANNVVEKDTAFRQGTAQTINDSGIIGADIKNQSENSKEALLHQHRFTARINLLGIGLGLETKITNNASLFIEGGTGFYLYSSSNGDGGLYKLPYGRIHARIYTNLKRRHKAGEKTAGFTGDYVSPFFMYHAEVKDISVIRYESVFYGLNYGFQRQIGKNIFWGIEFGAGMSTKLKNNLSTLDYLLRLNFGFTI